MHYSKINFSSCIDFLFKKKLFGKKICVLQTPTRQGGAREGEMATDGEPPMGLVTSKTSRI
jgi:hypothetical protein